MIHEQMVRASGDCAAGHRFDVRPENAECYFREAYPLTDNNVILVSLHTEINITLLYPTMSRQVQSQER